MKGRREGGDEDWEGTELVMRGRGRRRGKEKGRKIA